MSQFLDSGAAQHTTILLGAGASTTSDLPDWDELAVRLLTRSGAVASTDAAWLLVGKQDPLLVAESAQASSGDGWTRNLRLALYQGTSTLDTLPLHLAAAGHMLAGIPGDAQLVTLNFDTLLETAIRANSTRQAVSQVDGTVNPNAINVHHLHGVVTPRRSDQVILTLTDFTTLVGNSSPWQLTYLRSAIDKGALIIAGASYRVVGAMRRSAVTGRACDSTSQSPLVNRGTPLGWS